MQGFGGAHCQLWRVAEGHAQFYYDHQNPGYTLEALYDIIAGHLGSDMRPIYGPPRVGAGPDVRLACQLRPLRDLSVVPLVPPQISLLTARGPYADLIKYGQTKVGGDILNVSVFGGFPYADTPDADGSVLVWAETASAAIRASSRSSSRPRSSPKRSRRAASSSGAWPPGGAFSAAYQ